jgi:hypothetical protein
MKIKMIRQGDVLLKKITNLPKEAAEEKIQGRAIVALGEATGHHHSFVPGSVKFYRDQEMGGTLVIEVLKEGVLLEHQEHSAIPLDRGVYRHIHQREYTPEAIRNVVD